MNVLEIPDIDLKKELKKCNSMEDLVGKNGLMQRLFGGIIQQFLEAEMEEHLGREKYTRLSDEDKNYRNGYSSKNIRTSFGPVKVDVPRDRKSEFESMVVKKYETVCNELDKKVIGLSSSEYKSVLLSSFSVNFISSISLTTVFNKYLAFLLIDSFDFIKLIVNSCRSV